MDKYSWWDDPKNKEEVERLSWWNHDNNKDTFAFPISVVKDGDWWVATCNDETKKLLGDNLHGCAQGKTKQQAIDKMFMIIRMGHDYAEECRLNYQRWVPFRKGDWNRGARWFVIFGINFYFRYGNGMKGGRYVPFTKFNISISNEWAAYRNWKRNRKKDQAKNIE